MVLVGILSNTCRAPGTFSAGVVEGLTAGQRHAFRRRRGHAQHPASAPALLFQALLPALTARSQSVACCRTAYTTGRMRRRLVIVQQASTTALGVVAAVQHAGCGLSRTRVSPMCPGASGGCPSATSCTTLPPAAGRIHIRAGLRQSVSALHTVEVLKDMDRHNARKINRVLLELQAYAAEAGAPPRARRCAG